MSRTAQGRRLTEQHRQDQIRIRAAFLAEFLPTWSLLSWTQLDETSAAWVRVVMAMVKAWRQESADLAVRYYDDYRLTEVPNAATPAPVLEFVTPADVAIPDDRGQGFGQDRPRPVDLRGRGHNDRSGDDDLISVTLDDDDLVNVELGDEVHLNIDWTEFDKAAEKSLQVTGPAMLKQRAARGETEDAAKRAGLVTVSGSASRHVLNGGRDTTLKLVEADRVAIGWARVTDGDPCAYCAMLASRGPVYKTAATASFLPHDGCACTAEPTFSRMDDWPGDARAYEGLWRTATRGYSGQAAIKAFRRAYERQRREVQRQLDQPLSA